MQISMCYFWNSTILFQTFHVESNGHFGPTFRVFFPLVHLKSYVSWVHGSFGLLSSKFVCFFKGVWPSFSGLTSCLWFFGCWVLIICHLFPTRWSPYFFRYNGTCWDWYFSVLVGIMVYPNFITLGCSFLSPSLWKSYVIVVSSFTLFFDEFCLHEQKFSTLLVDVPLNVMWTRFQSCASLVVNAWLLTHPTHTYISFVFYSLPYIVTYPLWFVTSYYYTYFTLSMWT